MMMNHMLGHWSTNNADGAFPPFYQWHFQNGGTMMRDAINGENLQGGVDATHYWPSGRAGACLFTKTNAVGLPMMVSTKALVLADFSVSLWFKAEALTSTSEIMLARFAAGDGSQIDIKLVDVSGADGRWNVQVNWQNSAGSSGGGIDHTCLEGEWTFVGVAMTGGTSGLVVTDSGDAGDPQATTNSTNVPDAPYFMRNMGIASTGLTADTEHLYLDDICLWPSTVLSQTFLESMANGLFWNSWDNTKPLHTWQSY